LNTFTGHLYFLIHSKIFFILEIFPLEIFLNQESTHQRKAIKNVNDLQMKKHQSHYNLILGMGSRSYRIYLIKAKPIHLPVPKEAVH